MSETDAYMRRLWSTFVEECNLCLENQVSTNNLMKIYAFRRVMKTACFIYAFAETYINPGIRSPCWKTAESWSTFVLHKSRLYDCKCTEFYCICGMQVFYALANLLLLDAVIFSSRFSCWFITTQLCNLQFLNYYFNINFNKWVPLSTELYKNLIYETVFGGTYLNLNI